MTDRHDPATLEAPTPDEHLTADEVSGRFVPGTFSIAARDPETGNFGVAVSTALVGVGALCPFVSENAAVATQSFVKVSHGRNAVEMADRGVGVDTACEALIGDDDHAAVRQLHGVDADGNTYTFSGDRCVDWYGHEAHDGFTVAGNMLTGSETIEALAEGYEAADGEFTDRLISALEAAQDAGGDKRGKISAAVLVHAEEPKLWHNLRVDSSDDPVGDLRDLYDQAVETEDSLDAQTEEMLGEDYDREITDFGLKY
ncbi:MAG: DUF1028 domain-containing protein [Halolamina sp.]